MKTKLLFSSAVLASAFIAPSAMAQDFHALSKMAAAPAAMQDGDLASIEGGRLHLGSSSYYSGGYGGGRNLNRFSNLCSNCIVQIIKIKQTNINIGDGSPVQTNVVIVDQSANTGG